MMTWIECDGWRVPVTIEAERTVYGRREFQVRQELGGWTRIAWVAADRIRTAAMSQAQP